ncbi:MAG: aminodeoxychorismate synthase component I [Bacteroidota bacterium]
MGKEVARLSRRETIEAMNGYASRGVPFVFLISFNGDGNLVAPPSEAARAGFNIEMPGLVNHHLDNAPVNPIIFSKYPMEPKRYREAFTHVIDQIHYGNSFLLNLTFPTPIETNYSLRDIFAHSKAPYKLFLEDELVVFSPERFVRIQGDTITSNPMKGTIDANIPGAYRLLASDKKEDAEHNTIVDLIRNDLSTIATSVRVKRFKYIERVRTHQGELLQMSSEITGKLPLNFRTTLGEKLFKLLPAGSICGAPKKSTVEIIRKVEGYERGFYTGVFGHFDGQNMDSAVAIRYLEKQDEKLIFKSGGGITFQSDWRKEYDEMQKKVYVPIY